MKSPRVVVWAFDDWLTTQLREAVSERKWLLRPVRSVDGWLEAVNGGPCVGVIHADPTANDHKGFAALGELHRTRPDVDMVVVCDVKLNDEDRPAWTSTALDLGARLVLYPPLTRVVLEDAVIGLMERRFGPSPSIPDAEIDLAAGEYEEE